MAFEDPGKSISFDAGANLSSDQYKLVTLASDGRVDVTGATRTNTPIGILQNKPSAAGQAAEIMVDGISKAIAGETIAAGELVGPSSDTAGRVGDADTITNVIVGMAITGGAAGETISVLLFGGSGGEVS